MKAVLAVMAMTLLFAAPISAQTGPSPASPQRVQIAPAGADLNAILVQVQQASSSANLNIAKLRIEKWKTDSDQKKQMQEVADSLQKNISTAVPGLMADIQNSKGSGDI